MDVKPKNSHPAFSNINDWRKEIYEHFELRLKPLIKIDDLYICSDIEFVKAAFWDGPYLMILTDYPQSKISKNMLNYLEDTTELFIRHLTKHAFGDSFSDLTNKCNNPMGEASEGPPSPEAAVESVALEEAFADLVVAFFNGKTQLFDKSGSCVLPNNLTPKIYNLCILNIKNYV